MFLLAIFVCFSFWVLQKYNGTYTIYSIFYMKKDSMGIRLHILILFSIPNLHLSNRSYMWLFLYVCIWISLKSSMFITLKQQKLGVLYAPTPVLAIKKKALIFRNWESLSVFVLNPRSVTWQFYLQYKHKGIVY